jgi:hypothetical protein
MKESVGNAFIMTLVIIFITLIILFFTASFAYTKAFRVKSRIVNIIEKYNGYTVDAKLETENILSEIGYRVRHNEDGSCNTNGRFTNATALTVAGTTNYHYCVYKFDAGDKGSYYGVVTYMYFEIPLLGKTLSFPVYGETKTMGLLG